MTGFYAFIEGSLVEFLEGFMTVLAKCPTRHGLGV